MRNTKLDNKTEFWVKEIVEQWIDEHGIKRVKVVWRKQDTNLDLGSYKEPKNEGIIAFKWISKHQNPIGDMFSNFFSGGD